MTNQEIYSYLLDAVNQFEKVAGTQALADLNKIKAELDPAGKNVPYSDIVTKALNEVLADRQYRVTNGAAQASQVRAWLRDTFTTDRGPV